MPRSASTHALAYGDLRRRHYHTKLRRYRLFTVDDCASFANLALVDPSGGPPSREIVDVSNPQASGYVFVVDYFSAATGTSVDYKLWISAVSGDNGNSIVSAPDSVTVGATATATLDYSRLNVGSRYLGVISHQNTDSELDRTIVDVSTQ